jgi:RNA polymerase sigma-70 factor (ECF subfamily)
VADEARSARIGVIDERLARELFARANADRWRVDRRRFIDALERAVLKGLGSAAAESHAVERFCRALHLEDLALACACGAGDDEAWQHFVTTYRPALYRAADAIDRSGGARELADSLYGDLFGVTAKGSARASLFDYFHGRSSLGTWLRAVLAQRHVDRMRERRLVEPLPDDSAVGALAGASATPIPERPRLMVLMHAALAAAVAILPSRERLRLSCYYARQMTLARIGRLTGEHEATVSRQLARTRAAIRHAVEDELRNTHGLGPAEIEESFELMLDDPGSLDLASLLNLDIDGKTVPVDRSRRRRQT